MDFHIGQDIVCIDASNTQGLEQDKVYKVHALRVNNCKCASVIVDVGLGHVPGTSHRSNCDKCQSIPIPGTWHKSTRFKPLDELTDISELLEVLEEPAFK